MARAHELVLFGASGFTGRLVAEYLAAHAPAECRVALAGRNREKLEAIRAELPERARAWPILVADAHDPAALAEVARATKVVCTTVGPYAKYGLPLVAACAAAGTHYCDLTGEPNFMRDSIDRHHAQAQASGARIVHTCGFDSIPSDLGVFVLHEALGPLRRATYVVESAKGGFSGGTVASLLNNLDEVKRDRSRLKTLVDPYGLSPDRAKEPDLGDERDLSTVAWDDFTGSWTAPFVMASINTRVVRRSNALRGWAYGRSFRYAEVFGFRKGPRGFLKAAGLTAGMGLLFGGLMFGPTRTLLEARLPKPGEGPDEATRRNGALRVRFHAEAESGQRAQLLVKGKGDPGYLLTSLLLSEAALALALDEPKLPKVAGVLTPATALGRPLVDRLVAAGMTFELLR